MATPELLAQFSVERIVAVVAFVAAVFERFRSRKKELKTEAEQDLLSDAKRLKDRAELLGKLADDNAELFNKEQEAHKATRKFWHDKASDFQVDLAKCNEKIIEFQARPDYAEIVEMIRLQSQTSHEILESIRHVISLVKMNYEYASHTQPNPITPHQKTEDHNEA